jgi:excisionase family DNA binding protein
MAMETAIGFSIAIKLMSRSFEDLSNGIVRASLRDNDLVELLTVDELAGLLKVPKSWIYEHTRRKGSERLPHFKFGKYLRFDIHSEEFNAWLNRNFRN